MEKLYCEPLHGLGNRLMFMLSALRLSIKFKRKLVFVWSPDKNIDCNFDDLFSNFEFQTFTPNLPVEESIANHRYVVDLDNKRDIYLKGFHFIFTPNDFYLSKEDITLEHIKCWNKILFSNSIQSLKSTNYYDMGIHIRRSSILDTTDWGKPTSDIILNGIMNTIQSKESKIKDIYISSNNPAELNYMKEILSKDFHIFSSNSTTFSNDLDSIKSSFSDFFSLINCEYIFRRDISTFSALPSMLNASEEYLYTEDSKLITRKPLILSGFAL